MDQTATLRAAIESDELVVAPGVHDPLSARIAAQVGFDAVAMTGNGTSLATVGEPDVGTITLTEMVRNARQIQATVDVPVIADADTGFGNAVNVRRTVEAFCRAGVAAIHIEDQTYPKRCGFVEGKQVLDRETATDKIAAAVAAREDEDLLVIARTDARGAPGGSIETAIERVEAYCAAGADVGFVQGADSVAELEAVAAAVDAPLLYNCSGGSPLLGLEEAEAMGYDIAMFPRMSTLPTIEVLFERYGALQDRGTDGWAETKAAFQQAPVESYDAFAGIPAVLDWEARFIEE
jgi:2-methylisocitrate lyase-like PEP mutase family enzyme